MSTIKDVHRVHAEAISRVYKARPDYLRALCTGQVVGVKGDPREAAYLVFRVLDEGVSIDLYDLADALTARAAALQRSHDRRLGFWVAMRDDGSVMHAMAWMRLTERRQMLDSIMPDFKGVFLGVALPVEGAAMVGRRHSGVHVSDVASFADDVAFATRTVAQCRLKMRDEMRRLHDAAYALHAHPTGSVKGEWTQSQLRLLAEFRLPMGLPRHVKPWEMASIPDLPEWDRGSSVSELYTRFALVDRTHDAGGELQAVVWDYLVSSVADQNPHDEGDEDPDDMDTDEVPRT